MSPLRRVSIQAAGVLLLAHCLGLVGWAARLPVTTTLSVSTSSGPVTTVVEKTVVTLTAAVSGGGPGGQVAFCDAAARSCSDIHLLSTAAVTSLGVATIKFVPGIGDHAYKAVYLGTTQNAGATSNTATLTVMGAYATPTQTGLLAYGRAGNYGLTATVYGTAPSKPTGPVSFVDESNGNALLGTATLVGSTTLVDLLSGLRVANVATQAISPGVLTMQSADLNGDGFPDLVIGHNAAPVSVLLGNGDGTFTAKTDATLPSHIKTLVIVDLNGDGIPDLVAGSDQQGVTCLLGNGDGTFRGVGGFSDSVTSQDMASADFNGDGIPDLVYAFAANSTMVIRLGLGDGTFGNPTIVQAGGPVLSLAVGDFSRDGNVDVVADLGGSGVKEFLGNGDGTFTTTTLAGLGLLDTNARIQVADFNQDGYLDLAFVGSNGFIALGTGDGTFTLVSKGPSPFNTVSGPSTIGDFNGDGIPDLAFLFNSEVMVAFGNGDGSFTESFSDQQYPTALVAANFYGHGVSDLAVNNDAANTVNTLLALTVSATANVTGVSVSGALLHTATARYAGDDTHGASVSNAVGLLASQDTSVTLTATPAGGSSYGQQVTLMAVVTPKVPDGTLRNSESIGFYNGTELLGGQFVLNGGARLFVTTLPVGVASLTARYYGDMVYNPSTSAPLSYVVAPLVPQISFAVANQVYGVAPFAVSATSTSSGAITYSVVSGPATIAGNVVTLTGAGTVVLLASQAAAGNYAAGTQTASFQVSAPPTSVTFRLLSTKLVYARPTIFEVEIALHGKVVPTGSVQIVDGSTVVGTYPVYPFLEGYVVGLTPRLTVGQHTLVASYPGDKNYAPGVSAPVVVMVSARARR